MRTSRLYQSGADREARRTGRNVVLLLLASVAAVVLLAQRFKLGVPSEVASLVIGGGAPAGLYMTWEGLRQSRKAGRQSGPDQLVVLGNLDGDRDRIHLWTGDKLVVIGERQRDAERLGRGARGLRPGRRHGGHLELAKGPQRRQMRPGRPAARRGGTDDAEADRRVV